MAPQVTAQKPGQVSLAKFSEILCLNEKIWDIWCQAGLTGAGKYTRYKMSPGGGEHQNQIPFIRSEILETEPAVLGGRRLSKLISEGGWRG